MTRKLTVSSYWDLIFDKYKIIDEIKKNGVFEITAEQIKEFKEPRLMTKFDFSSQRPKVFIDNNLGILPINNGTYLLGKFNLYKKLPSIKNEPIILEIPSYIETIDPNNVYSESNALHVALLSGMLEDMIGEKLVQTISGRMRPNGFIFNVEIEKGDKTKSIIVDRPQIEVDGGYESVNKVVLIEAKNQQPEDFIIRQLYYPYKYWNDKVKKEVVPVFFTYDNGIYTLYLYKFTDSSLYNSLELIEQKSYVVQHHDSNRRKIELFRKLQLVKEKTQKEVPFPQANSFNLIIQTVFLVSEGVDTAFDISESIGFEPRQGNYYLSACRYLNLIYKEKNKYLLTSIGKEIINSSELEMNRILFEQILQHKVFHETYKIYLDNEVVPNVEDITKIIYKYIPDLKYQKDGSISSVTKRRSSTVKAWINWIIGSMI